MMTITYWQFAMLFFWPVWAFALYRLLLLGGRSADNWRWALDKAAEQREGIQNLLGTPALPIAAFTKFLAEGSWPDYSAHYEALKKGKDVALLYPEQVRDTVSLICYGYDMHDFWKFMKEAEPKAFKRWTRAHATRVRMGAR